MRDDHRITRDAEPTEYEPPRLREYGSLRVATASADDLFNAFDGIHNKANQS